MTHEIYKNGAIGKAKDNLQEYCRLINKNLSRLNGKAYVSVNKALVTQASSAIPVVPLYISLLYKIMKQKGLHEGCFEQMLRLFKERLYSNNKIITDSENRIRLDDYEMRQDIQAEINELWPVIKPKILRA